MKMTKNELSIPSLEVATLVQIIDTELSSSLAERVRGIGTSLSVKGRLGALDGGGSGRMSYDLRLSSGDAEILCDIPISVLRSAGVRGGEQVAATGTLKTTWSRYTKHRVLIKLDVTELVVSTPPEQGTKIAIDAARIEALKGLRPPRNEFPDPTRIVRIAVIVSKTGQALVDEDFFGQLEPLGHRVKIDRIGINMLSAADMVHAIGAADSHIIAIIRGGGSPEQFDVFDDMDVLRAFSEKKAYRVTGLGHTGNTTLLDLYADYSAVTPTAAGRMIRDCMEGPTENTLVLSNRLRTAEVELASAQRQLQDVKTKHTTSPWPDKKVILQALLLGIVIGVVGLAVLASRHH